MPLNEFEVTSELVVSMLTSTVIKGLYSDDYECHVSSYVISNIVRLWTFVTKGCVGGVDVG